MRKNVLCYAISFILALPLAGCVSPPADEAADQTTKAKTAAGAEAASSQVEAPQPEQAPRYSGPIEFIDATEQAGKRLGRAALFSITIMTGGRTYCS